MSVIITGSQLRDQVVSEGKLRYGGQKFMGQEFVLDPAWPWVNSPVYDEAAGFLTAGRFTVEQVLGAFWECLNPWNGNGYLAFVKTHDGGFSITRLLDTGNRDCIIQPPATDTRFAFADSKFQSDLVNSGLDMYGNPIQEFRRKSADVLWAQFCAGRFANAAFGVAPDSARWLLYNGHVTAVSDRYAWEPYRGLDVAQCVVVKENINHPGRPTK